MSFVMPREILRCCEQSPRENRRIIMGHVYLQLRPALAIMYCFYRCNRMHSLSHCVATNLSKPPVIPSSLPNMLSASLEEISPAFAFAST